MTCDTGAFGDRVQDAAETILRFRVTRSRKHLPVGEAELATEFLAKIRKDGYRRERFSGGGRVIQEEDEAQTRPRLRTSPP